MDIGLLIVRIVMGGLFVGHGAQKLFGWFGGGALPGTAAMMDSLGYRSGRTAAIMAGATEFGAGMLLVFGFLTAFAAAGVIGVMINAIIAVHLPKGAWNTNGGYEYPVVLASLATLLAFAGAGRYSLDSAAGTGMNGSFWGVWALALGLVAGFVMAATRQTGPAVQQREHEEQRRRAA